MKILSTSQQMKGDDQGHFELFDKIKRTPTTTKSSATTSTNQQMKGDAQGHFKIFDKIKRTPPTTKSSATTSTTITLNMSANTITIYVLR